MAEDGSMAEEAVVGSTGASAAVAAGLTAGKRNHSV